MRKVEPQPGDIILCRIHGPVGFLIMLGQALVGDASRYCHAAIYLGGDQIIAAQPGGVRYDSLAAIKHPVVFSSGKIPLTDQQRTDICRIAVGMLGTPYSFLQYPAIALKRFGVNAKWLDRYIADTGHVICSQFVDLVWTKAGVHIFSDNRLPGDVDPGDIANALIEEW